MVEVVIMLAIIVLISSIVLISFPGFSYRVNLQRAAQGLALSLRKAQNMALSVRQVEVPSGLPTPAGRRIPVSFGVSVDRETSPDVYVVFADFPDGGGMSDGRFDPAVDVALETVRLESGVAVSNLISDLGGTNAPQDVLNITFSVPEARMSIQNESLSVGESAEIDFAAAGLTATRSVVVFTTGQIYTK